MKKHWQYGGSSELREKNDNVHLEVDTDDVLTIVVIGIAAAFVVAVCALCVLI
jgi:hypothetical protein